MPFAEADEALLYDVFLRVVQDISGADNLPTVPNFRILDCRDRAGNRYVFLKAGPDELTSGVSEDFADVLRTLIEHANSNAPDPWEFEPGPICYQSPPEAEPARPDPARDRAQTDAAYAAYDQHPIDEPDEWGDLASYRDAAEQ